MCVCCVVCVFVCVWLFVGVSLCGYVFGCVCLVCVCVCCMMCVFEYV